ncbi:MAG: hypothetical protein FJY54_01330 [Betaproteobacteria bacterium]|nr:hypothetical protein [Betaproteobacteria bacterium]
MPAQVAAPDIRVGDESRYSLHDGYTKLPRGTLEYQVTAIKGDTVTVHVQHDGRASTELYTRDWNWRERPMTNLQSLRYQPAYPALPFPLAAGKTWRAYVNATDPATGEVNQVRIDGRVLGWDRVKVPAGEFDALKVERLVFAGNHDYFRSQEYITEVDWYAPRLGWIVKHSSTSGFIDQRSCGNRGCPWIRNDWNVLELVSHHAGKPGGRP